MTTPPPAPASPLPWRNDQTNDLFAADDTWIATMRITADDAQVPNATYLVTAANAHPALVAENAALREALAALSVAVSDDDRSTRATQAITRAMIQATAALAARGTGA